MKLLVRIDIQTIKLCFIELNVIHKVGNFLRIGKSTYQLIQTPRMHCGK